ncbi:MAG: branched chain amino acid aminotransferase, partial [Clostridia bacterium]|nr:branched chain amino acid aminotransferase [Clostridia bacterium]
MIEIRIEKTATPKEKPAAAGLGFGQEFSDHMFLMDYNNEKGWYNARIVPFGNLSIHPACTALHYGSEIFEGLKAYRKPDGSVQMFRPIENVRR